MRKALTLAWGGHLASALPQAFWTRAASHPLTLGPVTRGGRWQRGSRPIRGPFPSRGVAVTGQHNPEEAINGLRSGGFISEVIANVPGSLI